MAMDTNILFCKLCGKSINLQKDDAAFECRGCTLTVCSDCYTKDSLSCLVCAKDYESIAAHYRAWLDTPQVETLCSISLGRDEVRFTAKCSLLNGYVSFLLDSGKHYKIELLEIDEVEVKDEPEAPVLHITYIHHNRIFRFKIYKDDPGVLQLLRNQIRAAATRMKWVATVNYLRKNAG